MNQIPFFRILHPDNYTDQVDHDTSQINIHYISSCSASSHLCVSALLSYLLCLSTLIKQASDKALDLLVSSSSYITAFTPMTYQPCRLQGVLPVLPVGILFSRWASRLDAFSVYPFRTSLPSYALGRTTVAPGVRPSRSSRTRDSSSHDSFAHDG